MTETHEAGVAVAAERSEQAAGVLYLAFDLGWTEWKLALTVGLGQKPRLRTIPARDLVALGEEIKGAKERFGLSAEAVIVTCYEAGRDGFWLHRFLTAHGIQNLIVEATSIEVSRRYRRAKTDRLDATKLLTMLVRWHGGEHKVWSLVRAPSVAEEDRRQLHREQLALEGERTQHLSRLKSLLACCGLAAKVNAAFPELLPQLRQWDGTVLPPGLMQRLRREWERLQLVEGQLKKLDQERARRISNDQTPQVEPVRQLLGLRGIGLEGAWLIVQECLGWRQIRNRRELASLAGLTPTPYASGGMDREQGISKAGNRRLRWMMGQLAWLWLRYQPDSALSQWYERRFARGGPRQRKIGITAVARKLLIALWKYLHTGEPPPGARVSDWRVKVNSRLPHTMRRQPCKNGNRVRA